MKMKHPQRLKVRDTLILGNDFVIYIIGIYTNLLKNIRQKNPKFKQIPDNSNVTIDKGKRRKSCARINNNTSGLQTAPALSIFMHPSQKFLNIYFFKIWNLKTWFFPTLNAWKMKKIIKRYIYASIL